MQSSNDMQLNAYAHASMLATRKKVFWFMSAFCRIYHRTKGKKCSIQHLQSEYKEIILHTYAFQHIVSVLKIILL